MPPESSTEPWNLISGVVVDAIKTYHMEVAIATKQTPFALLKPNDGASPVLVKVVDTSLPGGKQVRVISMHVYIITITLFSIPPLF